MAFLFFSPLPLSLSLESCNVLESEISNSNWTVFHCLTGSNTTNINRFLDYFQSEQPLTLHHSPSADHLLICWIPATPTKIKLRIWVSFPKPLNFRWRCKRGKWLLLKHNLDLSMAFIIDLGNSSQS